MSVVMPADAAAWWVRAVRPEARLGLKGPDAPELLRQPGIAVPPANAIARAPDAALNGLSRCLRLGRTEFLLEQDEGRDALDALHAHARAASMRAWPVLRADCCLLLGGAQTLPVLSRLASYDFESLLARAASSAEAPASHVVMTLLADISVTLVVDSADPAAPQLRLWADASFSEYLERTLCGVHA